MPNSVLRVIYQTLHLLFTFNKHIWPLSLYTVKHGFCLSTTTYIWLSSDVLGQEDSEQNETDYNLKCLNTI